MQTSQLKNQMLALTRMTLKWAAQRLKMGGWARVSNCLIQGRKGHGAADDATKRSSRLVSFEDDDENEDENENLRSPGEPLCIVV